MKRIWFIILGDFIAFCISFFIIIAVRFKPDLYSEAINTHIIPFFVLFFSWALIFFIFGLYDLYSIKPTIPHLNRFGIALGACFGLGIFFFYFIPIFGIAPKTNLIFQIIGFGLISFVFRRIFYTLSSKKIILRPVVLVGSSVYTEEIKSMLSTNPQLGLKIIDHVNEFDEATVNYTNIKNIIFICENIPDKIPKKNILNFYQNGIEIIDIERAYERYLEKIPVDHIGQLWIIENVKIKENIIYTMAKKFVDIIFAIIVLIITSPIVLVCSLFIHLYDKGPIIYKQKRIGLNGKVFFLYKLRSMIVNSETNGAVWSEKNDNRITPVGRIIRKLHLDEIPQMINIIKGEISLVGPRPERPEFVSSLEKVIPHYELRHIIRPGFTGWAQIRYRYARTENDSKEKFQYDLYYIKNRNIFLDVGILLKTIQIIFTH